MIVFCINVKTYLIFSFLQESINSVLDLSYFRGKILSSHFPGAFCEFLLLSCDFCDFYACWIELMYLFWSIICSFWNRSRSRSASSSVIDSRSFYPEQIPRVTTKLLSKWSSRPWPMIECLYLLFVLNFHAFVQEMWSIECLSQLNPFWETDDQTLQQFGFETWPITCSNGPGSN